MSKLLLLEIDIRLLGGTVTAYKNGDLFFMK